MESQILRMPDLKRYTGLSKPTIYRLIGVGTFPSPIKLAARAVGWRKREVDQWLAAREPSNDISGGQ